MNRKRIWSLIVALAFVAIISTPQVQSLIMFPRQIRVFQGEQCELKLHLPVNLYVKPDKEGILDFRGLQVERDGYKVPPNNSLTIQSRSLGNVKVDLKLLGIIPIRTLTVDVVPPIRLIAGGHSIGVLVRTEGVMVTGLSGVVDDQGHEYHPAAEAGIKEGDVILRVNDMPIKNEDHMATLINEAGQNGLPVRLEVRRNGFVFQKEITPILCRNTRRYRIGLYIRDGAAGVGTLTYYDPESLTYGGLGHLITDNDTNQPITVEEGKIVKANVSAIEIGHKGRPGEKIGLFVEERDHVGTIERNTEFGIIGKLEKPLPNSLYPDPIPIALIDQIKEGPAEILTVIEGQRLEKFSVEIERVTKQVKPGTKGMVIKVTDPRLLSKTGGIVQGMSGSPIIQEGKLVGAVTHVFVNDPTRGYGVFIEWMLQEAGIKVQRALGPSKPGALSVDYRRSFFMSGEEDNGKGL